LISFNYLIIIEEEEEGRGGRGRGEGEEEEDFHMDSEVSCEEVHPLCGILSRRG